MLVSLFFTWCVPVPEVPPSVAEDLPVLSATLTQNHGSCPKMPNVAEDLHDSLATL